MANNHTWGVCFLRVDSRFFDQLVASFRENPAALRRLRWVSEETKQEILYGPTIVARRAAERFYKVYFGKPTSPEGK